MSALATDSATLDEITPLVLTFNEEPNIARCLERLTWARRVVVLDSLSTDRTLETARRFSNVEIHSRAFDDHASQWNHGLSVVKSPWVLSLDADYLVPEAFAAEAASVVSSKRADAVFARFRYCVSGRPIRASLYPPRAVLFKRDKCRYKADGHTQRLEVAGPTGELPSPFDHDDRKPFSRWLAAQKKYAALEAVKLRAPGAQLNLQDRVRRTVILGPPAVLLYTLFVRGALFDGWRGWVYTYQRTVAETMLSARLLRRNPRAD